MSTKGENIIEEYIRNYRIDAGAGRVVSPIRSLAEMFQNCTAELAREGFHDDLQRLKNLTIGDIDPTTFAVDGSKTLAARLGTQPWGTIHQKKEAFKARVAKDSWDSRMPLTRYQADALGLYPLRERFASFLNAFGFSFTADQTIITPGSMPGIHMFFTAFQDVARKKGDRGELVAPTPGFSVYYSQARQLDMEVVLVSGDPETGFLPKPEQLQEKLGKNNKVFSTYYLTPANNPTSTVYSVGELKKNIDIYTKRRPNGYLLLDLAYIEMVEEKRAKQLLGIVKPHLDRTIFAISMSKNFGVPRLRCAALLTSSSDMFQMLKTQSQLEYASESYGMALEALSLWEYVRPKAREEMFALLRKRQDGLIRMFAKMNTNGTHSTFTGRFFREVPLYVYAELERGRDVLDVFCQTGMLGVPGAVFGDSSGRWARFSVGLTTFV